MSREAIECADVLLVYFNLIKVLKILYDPRVVYSTVFSLIIP